MLVEREGYTGDQIYNCDESGLLWKALPTKTLSSSIEKRAEGYKLNKDRVTLPFVQMLLAMIVSLFFFFGWYEKPRDIKKFMKSLPVVYRYNKSSWMTKSLFSEWFHSIFVPHVTQNLEKLNLPKKLFCSWIMLQSITVILKVKMKA